MFEIINLKLKMEQDSILNEKHLDQTTNENSLLIEEISEQEEEIKY